MKKKIKNREGEKGAAMVMVLMISLLLLTASAGVLLETSMNTANVTDATAELQAYNAAESGIQSVINVLRGNRAPDPLLDSTKAASHVNNRISFRRAASLNSSNISGDASTAPRLSRWMNYSATNPDRITMSSGTYTTLNGYAYSVTVSDPDNTGSTIAYSTSAQFRADGATAWTPATITVGTAPNTATLTYNPRAVGSANLNVSSGSANTTFGSFSISDIDDDVVLAKDMRFEISVKMTVPYETTKVMGGWIKAGTFDEDSSIQFDFDSPVYDISGSLITLAGDPLSAEVDETTAVSGSMTQTEPRRILIKSIGYGPRGAKKQLEAVIRKNYFDGLSAPATLTLIGGTSGFFFESGNSQNVAYSGDDIVSSVIIPPIGTNNAANLASVLNNLSGKGTKTNITGVPSDVTAEMPEWLQSAENLDDAIQMLRDVAEASGRYHANGVTPPNFGNNADATGITFADGNVSLSGNGGGILVCTGTLTLHGGFDFNGLIIVTGAGGLQRSGGGNGLLQGNTVIAPYNPANKAAGFLAPKYDISGGGGSEIRFNSSSVANGMTAVSNLVVGVAEK